MIPTHKLNRRSFVRQITGGLAGFGALGIVSGRAWAVQATDCDPIDRPGQGSGRIPRTGVTDSDTGDRSGCGRGETRQRGTGPEPQYAPRSPYEEDGVRRRRSGITDSDPSDPAGDGRGGPSRAPPNPYDEGGGGRRPENEVRQRGTGPEPQYAPRSPFEDDGVRRRTSGVTDSDPSDPAGDGRGGPSRAPPNPYDDGGSGRRPENEVRQRGTGPEPAYPPRSPYEEDNVRRRTTGVTDSDPSDPSGDGRGTGVRRCSDSDSGSGADPGGQGRRC